MKLVSECMSCLIAQLGRAIKLLSQETSDERIVAVQQILMKEISQMDLSVTTSAFAGALVYKILSEFLQSEDPYAELKRKYNQLAIKMLPSLQEKFEKSTDPFITALRACILGNSIDFGSHLPIDIEKEFQNLEYNDLGGKSTLQNFTTSLKKAEKILMIGDNTGEIVFDKFFLEKLKKLYPNKKLTYAVREGPIINDATIEDAKILGMDKICPIVEASQTPGVIVEKSSNEFQKAFYSADLVLSKGQGNFESLIDFPTNHVEIYFLLKAKCSLMEKIFNIPQGTLLLVKKDESLVKNIEKRY